MTTQQRQAQLAFELGPAVTKRLSAYVRQYNAHAAAQGLEWCPRCQVMTETKTFAISTFIQERTCHECGYLKR